MTMIDIEALANQIALKILREDVESEKQRQDAVAKEITSDNLDATDEKEERLTDEGEDEGEENIDPKPKPEPTEDDKGEEDFEVSAPKAMPKTVSFDSIKKQINNLRAGKSLKDEDVSAQLKDYFDKLGQPEEKSLYVFLSSIAAILTGGTKGEDAPRPESMGVDVTLKKKKEKITKSSVPSVDASGDQAPIMVGEVADTSKFKMMVLETLSSDDKHRCQSGQLVNFGSKKCVSDLTSRIDDATFTRDQCGHGSANRASLNGTLKYLRQKLRAAQKVAVLKK